VGDLKCKSIQFGPPQAQISNAALSNHALGSYEKIIKNAEGEI
jgi:hypothetical protein